MQNSVARFLESDPFDQFTEIDPESGYIAHKIRINRKTPDSWRRLTFRILTDIRHAIDQAMFAATSAISPITIEDDIYFPWARSPTDLEYRMVKIPAALHNVVRRLEPYPRGDGYTGGDDTVFAVRDVVGPNKHRITIAPCVRFNGYLFQGTVDGDFVVPFDGWDSAKNEFVIALIEPSAKPDYNFDFALDIAFGDVERLAGKPVLPILGHFGRYAAFVVKQLGNEVRSIRAD